MSSVLQRGKMFWIVIFTGLLFKVSTCHITGYGNTTADYGGAAHYRCALSNPKGVLQVTWQRLFKDESIENLATNSKRFGQKINEPYQRKVNFTDASLHSTAITLTNVTWDDESCYICSFIAYPDGSKRHQTCLTVQGISKVKTQASSVYNAEDNVEWIVFSCSATGKPAPTLQWDVPSGGTILDHTQTTIVTNSDHTFTSSNNITVQVPADGKGHVDCVVNREARGQRRERIPFTSRRGNGKKDDMGNRLPSREIALIISAIMLISCIAVAAVVMKRKRLKGTTSTENV